MDKIKQKALVLLSGGADSTCCLLWAKMYFEEVECISFDYEQVHNREVDAGRDIACLLEVPRKVVDLPYIREISISSLLKEKAEGPHPLNPNLPSSFLPGRNLLFLTIAAMWAYTQRIKILVGGMCETDFSGYPDCRAEVILSLEETLSRGMEYNFEIKTPLMYLTKAESIQLIWEFPKAIEALSLTHTCYKGEYPPCGICPACILRSKGFKEAGLLDPLMSRVYNEVDKMAEDRESTE